MGDCSFYIFIITYLAAVRKVFIKLSCAPRSTTDFHRIFINFTNAIDFSFVMEYNDVEVKRYFDLSDTRIATCESTSAILTKLAIYPSLLKQGMNCVFGTNGFRKKILFSAYENNG